METKNKQLKSKEAVLMFAALAQETRLKAYQILVRAGSEGMPAGLLSEALGIPHNTLSFHLSHLSNAGVISSTKSGRSILYRANYEAVKSLIGFMVEDCCRDEEASIREGKNGCSIIELSNCC